MGLEEAAGFTCPEQRRSSPGNSTPRDNRSGCGQLMLARLLPVLPVARRLVPVAGAHHRTSFLNHRNKETGRTAFEASQNRVSVVTVPPFD